MRRLLRHSWSVGVLSALVVVGLLHVNPAGYSLHVPGRSSSTRVADTAPPSPHQENDKGPSVAIPLSATVPAAYPKQLLESAFDGTTPSKSHLSDAYHAAASSTRAFLAARLAGRSTPISRSHLFCVYRL